jgi:hypothetical protein
MIQRIQSIYLALVFIFSLLFLFLPMGYLEIENNTFNIKAWGLQGDDLPSEIQASVIHGLLIVFLTATIMILSLVTIFRYKKRLQQIQFGKLNILLHVGLVVLSFFYLDTFQQNYSGIFSYGAAVFMPLVSMILILLANRAIRKDENLVRSADRLR